MHLDCAMQPVGENKIIIYEEGFKNKNDVCILNDIFGEKNFITINQEEMYEGCSNVFSIKKFRETNRKHFEFFFLESI